jgi:hypothetical protein
VLVNTGVYKVHRSDHDGFTNALYAFYELLKLLTPENDHHGFANALYALYELLDFLTPESDQHT